MMRNGVDVDRLGGMVEAVKKDPSLAALEFTMHSEWKGGLRAQHSGGQYTVGTTTTKHRTSRPVITDEPPEILGTDAGVSPAEMMLAALASCTHRTRDRPLRALIPQPLRPWLPERR